MVPHYNRFQPHFGVQILITRNQWPFRYQIDAKPEKCGFQPLTPDFRPLTRINFHPHYGVFDYDLILHFVAFGFSSLSTGKRSQSRISAAYCVRMSKIHTMPSTLHTSVSAILPAASSLNERACGLSQYNRRPNPRPLIICRPSTRHPVLVSITRFAHRTPISAYALIARYNIKRPPPPLFTTPIERIAAASSSHERADRSSSSVPTHNALRIEPPGHTAFELSVRLSSFAAPSYAAACHVTVFTRDRSYRPMNSACVSALPRAHCMSARAVLANASLGHPSSAGALVSCAGTAHVSRIDAERLAAISCAL